MKKLNDMSMEEIITEVNICLGIPSIYDIWKVDDADIKPKKTISNPEGKLAVEMLADVNFANILMDDNIELAHFLLEHEEEIEKADYVMVVLQNYKESLKRDLMPEVREEFEEAAAKARKLLKGIERTRVEHEFNKKTGKIDKLIILDAKDEAENRPRGKRKRNVERLKELEAEENLGNIVQALYTQDIEQVLAYNKTVGSDLRIMTEYNSLIDVYDGDADYVSGLIKTGEFSSAVEKTRRFRFVDEMVKTLEKYVDEIDIDKMLLCSGLRYIEGLERGNISQENVGEVYRRLNLIRKHIKRNVKLYFTSEIGEEQIQYGTKELEQDIKRFIKTGESVKYISSEECNNMHNKVLEGEVSLNSLTPEMFDALEFHPREIAQLLKQAPDNYIFFLKQSKCPYSKNVILKHIKEANQCSTELLQLLCEKTELTSEEILNLFDSETITVSHLKAIHDGVGSIITNEKVLEKYKEYKTSKEKVENSEEAESKKLQLERYALGYRNTELLGNSQEARQRKADEFMEELGDEIEGTDLVPLYGLEILPLKTVVDWGGENIIEQLVETESLKPADARYLRDEALLDENVLERLFKNCKQMSYSYQVSLVYAVFDGQTPEEKEIRDRLAQYYHIENAMTHSFGNKTTGRKNSKVEPDEPKRQIKMRDPGAKYNLLASIDNGVKIEEGIIDGHIIFHYPNVEEGTVLIEKLHKIGTNKKTGQIEIKADNQSATYVMSEEEFIKLKPCLIQEGKIDRTQLTQRWWETRDPEHWLPHVGTKGWEEGLKSRFGINKENTRYSPEELSKIEGLIGKSIDSKKGEDR